MDTYTLPPALAAPLRLEVAAYIPTYVPTTLTEQQWATASVPVRPGDLIHGDRDGVVVIPREHSASVAADAEEMERLEGNIKLDLEAGADREEV